MKHCCIIRRYLFTWGIVLYAHLAMADSLQTSFQECMTNQSTHYLQSVTNLIKETDAKTFLSRLASSDLETVQIQRQAQILIMRMERPEVFNEFATWIKELGKKPDVICERGGYFSSSLLKFTKAGPESEYIWETGERHLTQNGWETEERKAKKHTVADVEKGKARNAATQLALVEYYLKFSKNFGDYEMIEILSCLQKLEKGGLSKDKHSRPLHIVTKDLIEAATADTSRTIPVRIKAMSLLPSNKVDMRTVAALEFEALTDPTLYDENNKIHYSTVFGACSFFNDFGTKEDLARLENLTPSPEWRHSLVKETIKALKGRLEKNGLGK
jgi:hypothetical protein